MNYYTIKGSTGSTMNISKDVFIQAAENKIQDLISNDLKDTITLKNGRKTCKISCEIDKKNKILVTVEIFVYSGENASVATERIQSEVYEGIYDITEISNVKVNVVVLGFVLKK